MDNVIDEEINAHSNHSLCSSHSSLIEESDDESPSVMGLRSSGGPMRGRSVKEFEEQLSNLKKENFNLKLRIYFLEEKMGTTFTLDKDNVVKKYIELQVDYANLTKELEEKQEMLCQAMKAIELEDDEHKKYVADKEVQLNIYKQEIEDLREQLQDIKYDSEAGSTKSDTTGFFSSKLTNSGNVINELQEKVKILESELHLEKENSASLQFAISQTETLRNRCENMVKEIQAKDEIIKSLHQENESINARMATYFEELKDTKEKLDATQKENQINIKKMNRRFEELAGQYTELKKKYGNLKLDLDREQKKSDRAKSASESRASDLEDENDRLKSKLKESQSKLEAAMMELRKNQNLAVPKSLTLKSNRSYSDNNTVSVQDTAASPGTPQKDVSYVQVVSSSTNTAVKSNSSTSLCSSPSSPDKYSHIDFEELIANSSQDKILSIITTLKNDYDIQRQKLFKLKTEQFKACEIIKNLLEFRNKVNGEIEQYQQQIKNLEMELESVVCKPTSDGESNVSLNEKVSEINNKKTLDGSKPETMEDIQLYKSYTVELESKIDLLEAILKEKDRQFIKTQNNYEDILKSLEEKEEKIQELEIELSSKSKIPTNNSCLEKGDAGYDKCGSFYKKDLEEKEKEIVRLNFELKKCSCYLQEIVNTELWEKNKEIEKLHCRQANSSEILRLKKDLSGKEQQIKILEEKISELGQDLNISYELEDKDFTSSDMMKNLQDAFDAKKELKETEQSQLIEKLKSELEKSEKLRIHSNEACTLLGARLEELAIFLDSLLKQKSILGFLGMHKERKLREIINTSIDLSKSFNKSLVYSNQDENLTELCNITSILNGSVFKDLSQLEVNDSDEGPETLSIIPGNITLTYQSHLYKQNNINKSEPDSEEVITALREQIVNLQSELKLRDNELGRFTASSKLSETDEKHLSEYAKELSKVYVTPNKSNTTSTTLKYQSDCASESEGWSEPDRAVSRARMGLTQTSTNKGKRVSESTDDDNLSLLTHKRQEVELRQEIAELKIELEMKTQKLEAAEKRLENVVANDVFEEVKNNLLETESKVIELERLKMEITDELVLLRNELNILNKTKEEVLLLKNSELEKVNKLLETEKIESQKLNFELHETREKLDEERLMFENKEKSFTEIENQLKSDLSDVTSRLEVAQSRCTQLEVEFNEKIKQINEEHVQRTKIDIEEKLTTINRLLGELDNLKIMVHSYEETIKAYKNREQDFDKRIKDYQEKVKNLRQEIDTTTVEYSDCVLDKTRLAKEKSLLEQELSRYSLKDREYHQQLNDIRVELETMAQNYQCEISELQKQKSELQMKVSVLESKNAELYNRFVTQTQRTDLSSTLPNMKFLSGGIYNRQVSHPSVSSEDILEECSGYNINSLIANETLPVDANRARINASPDLGIESDQGRFSSLENHISRPLLQTIELTESMSNMLDGDNNRIPNTRCDNQRCCQKTLEVVHENNDLKRKLIRMKRALEDTTNQLNLANQRKKEVEKRICKQIDKTSQVLRKAKANLDSGSESDMLRM